MLINKSKRIKSFGLFIKNKKDFEGCLWYYKFLVIVFVMLVLDYFVWKVCFEV